MKRMIIVLLIGAACVCFAAACGAGGPSVSNGGESPSSSGQDLSIPAPVVEVPEASSDEPELAEEAKIDWEFDAPEDHGMDSALLASLHEAVATTEINAIVIAKDGVIIDEYYKEGYDTSVFSLRSCSKSFTGALIGIAIDQGFISGVDAKLAEFLPQLASDEEKQEITIEHLLTHTSGIEWYEWGGNSSSWRPFQESENWVEYILSQRMAAQPGSTFNYTTGGSHLLAVVLQEATGKTAYEFGVEHVFAPMGMDSVEWRADPQGVTDGGNGIAMTARDAAKFGQLYLTGGKWGDAQILPAQWVEASTRQQSSGSGNSGRYGYQWWLRPFGVGDYETYYAMGHGGQFIFVVPELDLVAVITSHFPQNTYAPWPYFTDYILAAYTGSQENL